MKVATPPKKNKQTKQRIIFTDLFIFKITWLYFISSVSFSWKDSKIIIIRVFKQKNL